MGIKDLSLKLQSLSDLLVVSLGQVFKEEALVKQELRFL